MYMYTYNKSQKEQATISKQTKVSNIAEISEFLKNSEVSKPPGVPSLRLCTASQVIPTISPPPSSFHFSKGQFCESVKRKLQSYRPRYFSVTFYWNFAKV